MVNKFLSNVDSLELDRIYGPSRTGTPDHHSPSRSYTHLQRANSPSTSAVAREGLARSIGKTFDDLMHHRHPYEDSEEVSNPRDSAEIERNPPEPYDDPYHLKERVKDESEITQIRANMSKKRGCAPLADLKRKKEVRDFYVAQNESIGRLLMPVDEHVRQAKVTAGENRWLFKLAVNGSFAANVILAVLQVYGAISSGSKSLFTTMADALFDPLSNITLIACGRAVAHVDSRRFPSGKARIETAGNIVFCFLMTAVSYILIALSAEEIADGVGNSSQPATNDFHLTSIIVVAVAFCTKFALFLFCMTIKDQYSQVEILWQDHRNDLFINGFGLMFSVLGSKVAWWFDPMGAIILSVLVSTLWLITAYGEFQLLIGVTAEPKMLQWITYVSMTHSPLIKAIDTVRAYHSGPRIIVEVDVVIDQSESLKKAHDVAEELQVKIESMPDVERAYVHIDYETDHKPEHNLKKEL